MPIAETSRFKIAPADRNPDTSLREDQGWHHMDVRWLITADSVGSTMTVVGRTTMPPGVKAQHSWHRHPNPEEWELVVQGVGIKHVGEESFVLRPGDLAFVPRDTYHGLENGSETETLTTVWGYCGAASLEQAGYIVPENDPDAPEFVKHPRR